MAARRPKRAQRMIWAVPAEGLLVPIETAPRVHLPPEGAWVAYSTYWRRSQNRGDSSYADTPTDAQKAAKKKRLEAERKAMVQAAAESRSGSSKKTAAQASSSSSPASSSSSASE